MAKSFVEELDRFIAYRDAAHLDIDQATVGVTPKYALRKLGLKKDAPLAYKGPHLNCIGSKRWRQEHRV